MPLSSIQRFCLTYLSTRMEFPAYGLATIEHESNFDTWAQASDPRDLARGGSRGLTQMSWKTAVALDPGLQPSDLFFPSVNLDCFLLLYRQNLKRLPRGTIPGGSMWVRGLASLHNAGSIYRNPSKEVVTYMDSVEKLFRKWSRSIEVDRVGR